jgi:hypothetical protein
MKLLRTTVAAVALPLVASIGSAQSVNRIQMDNTGESLWWITSPTGAVGDPANGVVTADLYWKVLPANASRQCDGAMDFLGLEVANFDLDWDASEALYGWMISTSNLGTSGSLFPDYISTPTAPEVFVPDVTFTGTALPFFGNPNGPGGCPPPNYISGWVFQDIVADTAGNFISLAADGTTDWSVTHLFPAGMDLSVPDPNNCGSFAGGYGGDFTFGWLGSHDDLAPGFGENQPDRFGTGVSAYGGFGTGGGFGPEDFNGGAELAFLIGDSATLQPNVNAGAGLQTGVEMGLAGNVLGIGLDTNCAPVASATLGAKMFDQQAGAGNLAVFFGNVGMSLLDLGIGCVPFAGAQLGLNPGDPAFLAVFGAFGAPSFGTETDTNFGAGYGGATFGDLVATTGQVPLSLGCGSIGANVQLQGFRFSAGALVSQTQLFTVNLNESGTIQ